MITFYQGHSRGVAAEADAIGEHAAAEVDTVGEQQLKQTQSGMSKLPLYYWQPSP